MTKLLRIWMRERHSTSGAAQAPRVQPAAPTRCRAPSPRRLMPCHREVQSFLGADPVILVRGRGVDVDLDPLNSISPAKRLRPEV